MIQILFKSPHLIGWQHVEHETLMGAFCELDNTFNEIMKRNPHIKVYQISEIRINLIN